MYQKAYRYRIYPTKDQKSYLNETFGACRKVYNYMLDKAIKDYDVYKLDNSLTKPQVSGYDLSNQLTILKQSKEYSWLYNYSSCALQQKLLDLGTAFTNFFKSMKDRKKVGYPKFKSRYGKNTFRLTPMYFKVISDELYIAKLPTAIKIKLHRALPSEPSQVTISKTPTGEYYASFLCKTEPNVTNGSGVVGIDLGVKDLVVTSDGEVVNNPKYYSKYQSKLKLYQRRLSCKLKGSNNRNQARLKVAKIHEKIANTRLDTLHKLTRSLVDRYKTIVIEDLNVSGMSKNRKLAKHILDSSFSKFRELLTYKIVESNWCNLVIADRWFPSTQLCSSCGLKGDTKLKLSARVWTCQYCSTEHNRDLNASKNLASIANRPSMIEILSKHFGAIHLACKFELVM